MELCRRVEPMLLGAERPIEADESPCSMGTLRALRNRARDAAHVVQLGAASWVNANRPTCANGSHQHRARNPTTATKRESGRGALPTGGRGGDLPTIGRKERVKVERPGALVLCERPWRHLRAPPVTPRSRAQHLGGGSNDLDAVTPPATSRHELRPQRESGTRPPPVPRTSLGRRINARREMVLFVGQGRAGRNAVGGVVGLVHQPPVVVQAVGECARRGARGRRDHLLGRRVRGRAVRWRHARRP